MSSKSRSKSALENDGSRNEGHPNLWDAWRAQGTAALIAGAVVGLSTLGRLYFVDNLLREEGTLLFSPVAGILLALVLRKGLRISAGIFVGSFIAHLITIPSVAHALIYSLDDAAYAFLAGGLLRRFWPLSRPLVPSARFILTMMLAGGVVPVLVTSLATCLLVGGPHLSTLSFGAEYTQWCLGEMKGVLVLTPLILLLTQAGALRQHLRRPKELVLLLGLELALLYWWIVPEMLRLHIVMSAAAGWGLVILVAFFIVMRCGVGGTIIGNFILALAMGQLQVDVALEQGLPMEDPLLLGFYLEVCILALLSLTMAGGIYDYARAERALHEVSSHILSTHERERRHLSANLHDGALQMFTHALMHLAGSSRLGHDPDVETAVKSIRQGIKELRDTLAGLRPELLERHPFSSVLENHCQQVEARAGVEVMFLDEAEGTADTLSLEQREHLFRLAQESLNNAVKHGLATLIEVHLHRKNTASSKLLLLEVRDDGTGFDPALADDADDRPHFGLRVMRERALLLGGRLVIDTAPGMGTQVVIEVPTSGAKHSFQK